MSSAIMSLLSVYFCVLLPLLSPFVSGAAIGAPLDKRALQCDASAVALVKTQITHPYYFCTWYLDSANPRTHSPLPALDAAAIGQACKCVIASESAPVHLQSVTAVPTSATCQASDLTLVKTEYVDPESFCTFFNAAPRPDSPVPGKSAQSLIKACSCYLSAKPSSTTLSSKPSSATSSAKPSSTTTSAVTISTTSRSTSVGFCSSTAIAGLKSNSAAQSFCNSFMRSTVSALSTAISTSTVAVPSAASVFIKTATSVINVTSTSLVDTTVTSRSLIPTTVVKTKTTTDITATIDVGTTIATTAVETVYVADDSNSGPEQRVSKRTISATSTVPVPSSWTGLAKAQLSSACGCVLPSATYSAFTTYTSTTTKVVSATSTRSASSSTTTTTVTSTVVVSKFSTILVVKSQPTIAATTNTTVTNLAESTISSDILSTQIATTTLTLNDAFCTSFLGYQPSTITVTSATTESTILVYNATVTQAASPTTTSTTTETVTATFETLVKREPTPVSVAIKPTLIITIQSTTSTSSSSPSSTVSTTTATTTHLSMAEVSASCSALATGVVTITISTTLSPTVFATETVTASPTTSSTSTTSTTSSAPTCIQSTVHMLGSEFIETCDYDCTAGTQIVVISVSDLSDCLQFCSSFYLGTCHSVALDTTRLMCHLYQGARSPAITPTEGYSYAYMPGG